MVSRGLIKRGVGLMRLTRVKHPVLLAKEMLLRGEKDDGDGAQTHCLLAGEEAEALAGKWGLELVDPKYFYTELRWKEHLDGLKRLSSGNGSASWDLQNYVPQGTTGCVALDQYGVICAATSTGGMTNKVPGRVGDTPTIGAGFWAEEWEEIASAGIPNTSEPSIVDCVGSLFNDCLIGDGYRRPEIMDGKGFARRRAMGISGTGSGDTFVRLCAARTTVALARYAFPFGTLGTAIHQMSGPNGEIQRSVGDRWGRTGEGEAGMIGIEFMDGVGNISIAFNTPGMFRGYVKPDGTSWVGVFSDDK
jgi:L-asparaginase